MGAVRTAIGTVVGGEALQGQHRIEPLRDALHRGVAVGQILLGEAALIIAAHPRPQKDIGRIELAGRRLFVVQGEIGIDDQLETVVKGIGLFHPVGQQPLSGELFPVFQVGDELFFPLKLHAVDASLELVTAAAERGHQLEFSVGHLVGKEERPIRFLLPCGDIGQMALDDGLANGLVREFRTKIRVALPAFLK